MARITEHKTKLRERKYRRPFVPGEDHATFNGLHNFRRASCLLALFWLELNWPIKAEVLPAKLQDGSRFWGVTVKELTRIVHAPSEDSIGNVLRRNWRPYGMLDRVRIKLNSRDEGHIYQLTSEGRRWLRCYARYFNWDKLRKEAFRLESIPLPLDWFDNCRSTDEGLNPLFRAELVKMETRRKNLADWKRQQYQEWQRQAELARLASLAQPEPLSEMGAALLKGPDQVMAEDVARLEQEPDSDFWATGGFRVPPAR